MSTRRLRRLHAVIGAAEWDFDGSAPGRPVGRQYEKAPQRNRRKRTADRYRRLTSAA